MICLILLIQPKGRSVFRRHISYAQKADLDSFRDRVVSGIFVRVPHKLMTNWLEQPTGMQNLLFPVWTISGTVHGAALQLHSAFLLMLRSSDLDESHRSHSSELDTFSNAQWRFHVTCHCLQLMSEKGQLSLSFLTLHTLHCISKHSTKSCR